MNPLKVSILALAIGSTAMVSKPAKADHCCSGFWSCAAAVFTAGLSCAAQHATQEIERLLANARRIKEEGDRMFDASIGELNTAMVNATRAATDHVDSINRNSVAHERQAREIYQRVYSNYQNNQTSNSQAAQQATANAQRSVVSQSAGNATIGHEASHVVQQGSSPVPQNVQSQVRNSAVQSRVSPSAQAAMTEAAATSNKLTRDEILAALNAAQQKIAANTQDSSRGYEEARRTFERVHQQAVNHMRDVFSTSFAAPMVGAVIGPLSATIVDPIAFLVTITSINRTLEVTVANFDRLFPPAVDHSNGLMARSMEVMENTINSATNKTSESGRIVNAMLSLERRADRYAYSQLNDLTGHQNTGAVSARGSSGSGSTLQVAPATATANTNLASVNPSLVRALNVQYRPEFNSRLTAQLRELSTESKQLQTRLSARQNTSDFEKQMDRYWEMEFKGKNAQQIEARKRELTNEINRRFAQDTNAKNKGMQVLNAQERKYKGQIQTSPALINPQPAISPQPTLKPPVGTPQQVITQPQVATPPGVKPITPNNQLPQSGPEPKPVPKLNQGIQQINKPGQ